MNDIEIFDDISVEINEKSLMERMQLGKTPRGSEDLKWAVEQAKNLIHPRVAIGVAPVSLIDDTTVKIGDQEFTSRILRVNLEPCKFAYPFIATIGPELENLAAKQEKLTRKFFLEIVGDYSLLNAVMQIEEKVKSKNCLTRIGSMSPGELENWPIAQQIPLFTLFESSLEQMGMKLTSSLMMRPRKSRSGIVFETKKAYINCQLCTSPRCPGRRAKYMPEKYAEYDLPIPK